MKEILITHLNKKIYPEKIPDGESGRGMAIVDLLALANALIFGCSTQHSQSCDAKHPPKSAHETKVPLLLFIILFCISKALVLIKLQNKPSLE